MDRPISLGFSPCPNDTYIFHALAEQRISTAPHTFRIVMGDVEELNREATAGNLDVSKVSIHAVLHLMESHCLLRAGGAMGRGCGPLVVSRKKLSEGDISDLSMAIPGRMTTAGLLLRLHGVHQGPVREMVFHQIMPAVAEGKVDAGVIIHEGRFTYPLYGLHLVLDLGAWWERETGLPLPLGGIVMKRSLGGETARFVEGKIRESLRHSRNHPEAPWPYIRRHAQEMEPDVMHRHIEMFVNQYTEDVGEEGEKAVETLLEAAARLERMTLPRIPFFCSH